MNYFFLAHLSKVCSQVYKSYTRVFLFSGLTLNFIKNDCSQIKEMNKYQISFQFMRIKRAYNLLYLFIFCYNTWVCNRFIKRKDYVTNLIKFYYYIVYYTLHYK